MTLDKAGHYTVSLGSTTSQGLPASPFAAGEARWLACTSARASRTATHIADERALRAESSGCGDHRRQTTFRIATGSAQRRFRFRSNSNNAPAANTITCSTSSACKSGHIPVFASNGGAAKVKDSIIQESGSTLSVAGSASLTGPISASTTSSSSAAVVGYDNTSGGSAAVSGTSTNGTGVVATGVTGLLGTGAGEDGVGVSASGNFGVYANGIAAGVYGVSTTSTGVIGTSTSYIGVYGSGATGVNGVSSAGNGVTGVSSGGPGVLRAIRHGLGRGCLRHFNRDWGSGRQRLRLRRVVQRKRGRRRQSLQSRWFVQDRSPARSRQQVSLSLVRRIAGHDEHLQRQRDYRRATATLSSLCRSGSKP